MRVGDWECHVITQGSELLEHRIQDHWCVGIVPGTTFQIFVRYHGAGQGMYEVLIDGVRDGCGTHWFDADGVSCRGRKVKSVIRGFRKRDAFGNVSERAFTFEETHAHDRGSGGGSGTVDWMRGHITVRCFQALPMVVDEGAHDLRLGD